MFEVRLYAGEPPSLVTGDRDQAIKFWLENRGKVYGQVGVFDRAAHEQGKYPWIA